MAKGEVHSIEVTPHAIRSLKKLKKDKELLERIDKAIDSLAKNPRPPGCKKLPSSKFDNLYRIREGDWRILYAVHGEQVLVIILDVRRRNQAYRGT
jgi:mRNA interferase RelE/StbE